MGLSEIPCDVSWSLSGRKREDARLLLLCFPYAGGSAAVFNGWVDRLPSFVDTVTVELPGHGSRLAEPPFRRLLPLAESLAAFFGPRLDRPFALFGHSMGALVGYELARCLQRRHGLHPELLVVAGQSAPHLPRRRPPIHGLPEDDFLRQLRRLGGVPREVGEYEPLLRLALPALRADIEACETYTYHPGPPLRCPIEAYGGSRDPEIPRRGLEEWRHHTTGAVVLRPFPGGHFFVNTARDRVLSAIAGRLDALAVP